MKRCGKCGAEKPEDGFGLCGHDGVAGRWLRGTCRACENARNKEWRAANPAVIQKHRRRQEARLTAARAIIRGEKLKDLDVFRRALAEKPEKLRTEKEAAAYFQGFLAGSKRVKDEGERFERLKDLAHRIAAEFGKKSAAGFFGYEEFLSYAYEGLLDFLRRKRGLAENLEHERKMAAQAIRWAITDGMRREGEHDRGKLRNPTPEGALGVPDDFELPSKLVLASQASQDALGDDFGDLLTGVSSGRTRALLERLAKGQTLREAGEAFGLSEGRVCQLVREVRETFPGLRERLMETA